MPCLLAPPSSVQVAAFPSPTTTCSFHHPIHQNTINNPPPPSELIRSRHSPFINTYHHSRTCAPFALSLSSFSLDQLPSRLRPSPPLHLSSAHCTCIDLPDLPTTNHNIPIHYVDLLLWRPQPTASATSSPKPSPSCTASQPSQQQEESTSSLSLAKLPAPVPRR